MLYRLTKDNKEYDKINYMHINKCGGWSFHMWYKENFEQNESKYPVMHDCGPGVHNIVRVFRDDVAYLTTVRNPYDRVASIYYQWYNLGYLSHGVTAMGDPSTVGKRKESINPFVYRLAECYEENSSLPILNQTALEIWGRNLHRSSSPLSVKYLKPCSYWIRDLSKFKIFKLEDNHERQQYFFDQGWYQDGPRMGVHEHTKTKGLAGYKHLYDEKSLDIIKELFKEDFENFGYDY